MDEVNLKQEQILEALKNGDISIKKAQSLLETLEDVTQEAPETMKAPPPLTIGEVMSFLGSLNGRYLHEPGLMVSVHLGAISRFLSDITQTRQSYLQVLKRRFANDDDGLVHEIAEFIVFAAMQMKEPMTMERLCTSAMSVERIKRAMDDVAVAEANQAYAANSGKP